MPTIDMSDIVNDPDLAQDFVVVRTTGSFVQGGFVPTSTTAIDFYGVIQPAGDEDLAQVPEGDRKTGAMSFISTDRMYETRAGNSTLGQVPGFSDTIMWREHNYKIVASTLWGDYGFWKAVGTRQP